MPPKKKGKASKLARMSDEERARYLQHRADLELEAKRRKQQLIAIFTKNKLKREEAFARINTAKINEQWRTTLRRMKCLELKDGVQYLWQDFEETLKLKDEFIKKLFDELVESDLDHQRFQEAHMMALDSIIEKGHERIHYLHSNFEVMVKKIETTDVKDMKCKKSDMKEILLHLKTIIYAKSKCLEDELMEIKTRNAVNIHNVVYSKNESIHQLKRKIYPQMELSWQQINDVIATYEKSTESKRKQYEYLKEQDDAHQVEAAQFPKMFARLKEILETRRKSFSALAEERYETIEDLRIQSELLTKRVCNLRQEMKITQNIDTAQLKRLSVLSSEVIKDLERILEKGVEIQTVAKLCTDLEPDSLHVKKYSLKNLETPKEIMKSPEESLGFIKKIEGFRDHLMTIKEENYILKQERNVLIEENNRLKHCLRSYLQSVSRIPTIRPLTRA